MWRVKYEKLMIRYQIYEEFFNMLNTRTESDMLEAMRRIKHGTRPETVVEQLRGGPLLMQLSSLLNRDEIEHATTRDRHVSSADSEELSNVSQDETYAHG